MFSTQIASTGPSRTIHLKSREMSFADARIKVEESPSVHSFIKGLYSPYSSYRDTLWTQHRGNW